MNRNPNRESIMQLIHTSPVEIKEINSNGLFGDCLFFSANEYAMGKVKAVYAIEINDDAIINVSDLHDDEIIERIASALDIDCNDAERVLDGRDTAFDHGGDGEDDWWVQRLQGECAKIMGYEACEAVDEQGCVFIVAMLGREDDLIRIS